MQPWQVVLVGGGVAFAAWYTYQCGWVHIFIMWWEDRKNSQLYTRSQDEGGPGDDEMKPYEIIAIFMSGVITIQLFRLLVPGDRPVIEYGATIVFFVVIYLVLVPAIKRWQARKK